MATQQDLLKLSMLPLERFSDPTITVVAARDKWSETKKIVDAVKNSGLTLGAELQQSLDNLGHAIDVALYTISQFQAMGNSTLQLATDVDGLDDCRIVFMKELPKAQALFAQVQAEAGLDVGTQFTKQVVAITAPPSESKLFGMALVIGGLLLVKVVFFDK